MKALTFFLSLLILAGVNYEADAQYSRRSNTGGVYASNTNANSRNSDTYTRGTNRGDFRNATRSERRRFQNNLVRRADRLDNLEYNLQVRQEALNGRGIRRSRANFRSNNPRGLLTLLELITWENRLNRKARRLAILERDILRAERRRGNNRRNSRGGNRNTRGNNGGDYCPPGWG